MAVRLGAGAGQEIQKALEWFVRSAYNGYAPAQTEPGILYHAGIMVAKASLQVFDGTIPYMQHGYTAGKIPKGHDVSGYATYVRFCSM